jgi:hypothetical protein
MALPMIVPSPSLILLVLVIHQSRNSSMEAISLFSWLPKFLAYKSNDGPSNMPSLAISVQITY